MRRRRRLVLKLVAAIPVIASAQPVAPPWRIGFFGGGFAPPDRLPPAPLRQALSYVERILKHARLPDLPMEQPTQYELAINMKAAKALGVAIPQSLFVRADGVIQ